MQNVVYVLSHLDAVKVGRTTNLKNRVNSHRTSNPWIKLEKYYEVDPWIEEYVHKRLADHLREGCTEWFNYYDGIYEDIDRYIEEGKEEGIRRKEHKRQQEIAERIQFIKNSPYKVFKFKDCYRNDYAYIVTNDLKKATLLLNTITFVKCEFVEQRDLLALDKFTVGVDYMHYCTIRNRDEFEYCRNMNIDYFKEYGITTPRRAELMTSEGQLLYLKSRYKGSLGFKPKKKKERYSKKWLATKNKL